jgi:hypothetical protein
MSTLHLELADKAGLRWSQEMVAQYHYLKHPVDSRCSPLAYHVMLGDERVGCLIFGRPEATRVNGWYGSVEDIASGKCRLSRWSIINLARVWLHPSIQSGGEHYVRNAATWAVAQGLQRVVYDFLVSKPPVWVEEPYEILECLSYCDTSIHQGTLYKASNFKLMRKNERGIETYARPLRRLSHAEHKHIQECSRRDKRAQKLRSDRQWQQLSLLDEVV